MRTRDNAWTDEEVRHLALMFRSGRTIKEIAAELGRTESAIQHKIKQKRTEEPHTWRVVSKKHSKRLTNPCADCLYGSGLIDSVSHWKCPWADRLMPVPGWDAEAVPYRVYNTNCADRVDITFDIKSCPHFKEG
jgi:hypothetical protein